MSIFKSCSSTSKSAGRTLDYALNQKKTIDKETGERYVEGFGGCNPETAKEDFKLNKQYWNKTDGRQCLHFVNSFKGHEVTPRQALEETRELIERSPSFKDFQGTISCHCNEDNIHIHIVVDSVNTENGAKWNMSPGEYKAVKELNQEICREHGYSVTPLVKQNENLAADNINKYKVMESGKSEIQKCYDAVRSAMSTAVSKDDFKKQMEEQGFKVNWDNKKYITFESLTEKKGDKPLRFRDKNLSKTFQESIGKESINNAIEENRLCERTNEQLQSVSANARIAITNSAIDSSKRRIEELRQQQQRERAESQQISQREQGAESTLDRIQREYREKHGLKPEVKGRSYGPER